MSKLSKHEKVRRLAETEVSSESRGLFQFPPSAWSPTEFRPEANAMGALRAYWEAERLFMLRRIMMQRRQLKFLNRAVKKRDGKLAEERLKFRETERKLLDQLAVERDERNALEHRLYGVSNRSNPWAGK